MTRDELLDENYRLVTEYNHEDDPEKAEVLRNLIAISEGLLIVTEESVPPKGGAVQSL